MAKDRSSTDHADKKEKKHKHRHSSPTPALPTTTEDNGITKKSKKDKEKKKHRKTIENAAAANGDDVVAKVKDAEKSEVDGGEGSTAVAKKEYLVASLVPFAHPLATDKTMRKVLKGIRKSAKHKTLKRGVKEVVKALRKSGDRNNFNSAPSGLVVMAADISPPDVISHIPVLCEDHNVPYVFIPSRAELGAAGNTKRPTSVVLISAEVGKSKPKEGEGDEESETEGPDEGEDWSTVYKDLTKVVLDAGKDMKK